MATYRLYNYWRSSSSYRVRIALHQKGLPFEYVAVNLLKTEQRQGPHLARNPLGSVPVLEVDDGGRALHIAQSVAIFEYLEEKHPEQPLLPQDPIARAHTRALAETINSGPQPLQNLKVLNYVRDTLKADSAAWAKHWIGDALDGLERLAQPTARRFLMGDSFTWADACLVPQLFAARRFGVDLANYPTLSRVETACLQLEAVQRAAPERQPDAQPT